MTYRISHSRTSTMHPNIMMAINLTPMRALSVTAAVTSALAVAPTLRPIHKVRLWKFWAT